MNAERGSGGGGGGGGDMLLVRANPGVKGGVHALGGRRGATSASLRPRLPERYLRLFFHSAPGMCGNLLRSCLAITLERFLSCPTDFRASRHSKQHCRTLDFSVVEIRVVSGSSVSTRHSSSRASEMRMLSSLPARISSSLYFGND